MTHTVIIVPGLGDRKETFGFAVRDWERKYDIKPIIKLMNWRDRSEGYEVKLNSLLKLIDDLSNQNQHICLLGASAGGSAVMNAYCARRTMVHKVINVCGRMRKGVRVFPSLELAAQTSPAFYQSVTQCEKNVEMLSVMDKNKMLVIKSFFDEIVPSATVTIPQVRVITVPMITHGLSIAIAMTMFSKNIADFIVAD